VNPFAIGALDEIGIDIRSHRSKSVDGIDPAGRWVTRRRPRWCS
jgi:hypothetical protein